MVWGLFESRKPEPAAVLGNDASAAELIDGVVQDLVGGRSRSEIIHDLVRLRWQRPAANRFCQLAQVIANEVRHSPESRTACARRGMERIQAAYGWIGSGMLIALMLWVGGKNLERFAPWSLLIVGYGLVELISGIALWWPHKSLLPAGGEHRSATGSDKG